MCIWKKKKLPWIKMQLQKKTNNNNNNNNKTRFKAY